MGKKGKVGKQRKDNYYKLAKQKGFRSRAAFKLIQLNRKFQFLENARVCIDLCAAPGGWLQVAAEYMPVSSVIIGVDLVPITPIRNVITFQSDITTKECSKTIENKLSGWTADIVLHDGAPNIGKNWLHDAYGQNVLVVNALKIACSHLSKGGWFITKIFRSSDYNSLLWVFNKLFGKVHATKPQASRSESAEIFVVCQNYKKPDVIDPSFFNPTTLFADISEYDEALKKRKADLLKPASKIKKTKAHGYEEGELYTTVTDIQFVTSNNHMDYLAQCLEIKLTNQDIIEHESTTDEIKECCKDVRVLGRKDLLKLLKWRRNLRKDLTAKLMQAAKEGKLVDDGDSDDSDGDNLDHLTIRSDDDGIDEVPALNLDDIEAQQNAEEKKELKRLKRKEEKRVKDYQQRLHYGMVNEGDVLIEEEHDLFNLKKISSKKQLKEIDDVEPDETVEDTQDTSDVLSAKSGQRKSVTFAREASCQYFELDEDYESDEDQHPADDIGPEKPVEPKIAAPKKILKDTSANAALNRLGGKSNVGGGLLTDLMDVNQSKIAAATKFFDRDTFTDIDLEKEFQTDLVDKIVAEREVSKPNGSVGNQSKRKLADIDLSKFDDGIASDEESDDGVSVDSDSDSDSEELSKKKKKQMKLDPEGLALASMMVSSDKMRQDIEDEGWNRYAHADVHLAPKWFREEEEKYCRRNIPVRQELVKEYKLKLRQIDAKPIKKELQAKARKKRRAMRKMDKVRKKVESITTNDDLTQKEQISQIKTVYKNATKTKRQEIKTVVGRKGLPTKKPNKGKYKMVDARMKKDARAKQRREGKGKQGKKSGGGGAKKGGRKKKREANNSFSSKSKGPQRKVRSSKGSSKSRSKR